MSHCVEPARMKLSELHLKAPPGRNPIKDFEQQRPEHNVDWLGCRSWYDLVNEELTDAVRGPVDVGESMRGNDWIDSPGGTVPCCPRVEHTLPFSGEAPERIEHVRGPGSAPRESRQGSNGNAHAWRW